MSKSAKLLLALLMIALASTLLVAATSKPTEPVSGQAGKLSPLWVEGANVKLNHDNTSQLQNEEACVINPNNPDNVVAVWRDFRLGYRQIGVGTTFDGGANWSDSLLVGTPYDRVSDPVMSYMANGDILACVLAFPSSSSNSGIFVYKSTNGGTTWNTPIAAVDEGGPDFEDKQWMGVDRTNGPYKNRVYVPWTRFGSTVNIMLVFSDYPADFSTPVRVSDASNVQWPSITVGADGTVYVAWVNFGSPGIMLDKSTNGGGNWGVDKKIVTMPSLPSTINGSIQVFPYPAMEADITGGLFNNRIYVAYSGFAADGNLDIYIINSTNNGVNWSSPVRINDDPLGNHIDQFHPWISINEEGILTAVWFDRRLDPANLNWGLFMSHSFDGGATWTANRRISDVSSSPNLALKNLPHDLTVPEGYDKDKFGPHFDPDLDPQAGLIGEYTGLSTRHGVAQSVWVDTRNGNQDAYGARVTIAFSGPPLILPIANTISNNASPTFSWGKTGATPAEIANFPGTVVQPVHYKIEIDNDSTFSSIDYTASGLVPTNYQFGSALTDGVWFWRVSAVNDSGRVTGFAEQARRFTIDTQAPSLPLIVTPAQDSTVSYQTQNFTWSAVSRSTLGTSVTYQLQVSQDSSFTSTTINVTNLSSSSYSNATPLAGNATYYCRVKATDAATNTSGFTASRRFHTTTPYLCGDPNHDGQVNISDVVYLISFIFSGGPAPNPVQSGDANCDANVNISDAVYLIAYIFAGSTAPCGGC